MVITEPEICHGIFQEVAVSKCNTAYDIVTELLTCTGTKKSQDYKLIY